MTDLLPTNHKPTFRSDYPATLDNIDKCLADQQLAITQFSLSTQLPTAYAKASKRNPEVKKEDVIIAVLLTAPGWADENLLDLILDELLSRYSNSMANA